MDVTLYTTPNCPYCAYLRQFLNENGVTFVDNNVSASAVLANEMVSLSGQMAVPCSVIDGKLIVGWNKIELEKALKLK